ncbi:MAG: hypothetical protein AAFO77_05560 [Pseudomonadota bacterium]
MADFAAILRKNIEKLGVTSPEIRAKVYDKAREALRKKLDAMDPAPPQAAIDRQFEKMSAAVAEVETDYAPVGAVDPLEDIDGLLTEEAAARAPSEPEVPEVPEAPADETPVAAAPVEDVPVPEMPDAPEVELAADAPEAPSVAVETDDMSAPTQTDVEDDPLRAFLEENADALSGDAVDTPEAADIPSLEPNTERISEIKARARANAQRLEAEAQAQAQAQAQAETDAAAIDVEPEALQVADAPDTGVSVDAPIAAPAPPPSMAKPSPAWGRLLGFGLIAVLIGGGAYIANTVPEVRALVGLDAEQTTTTDESGLPVRSVETTTVTPEDEPVVDNDDTDADTDTDADSGTLQAGDVEVTVEGDNADTVVVGTGQDTEPKFTQRLTEDGREVDEGPADGAAAPGEGTSVADQTPGTAEAEPDTDEQVASDDAAPEDDAGDTPLLVGQRAIFYEERTGTEAGTAVPGSIIWTQVQESPGGDLPLEPAIRGEVNVPDLNLSLVLTVRRNGDVTFPASHIIEMFFAVPDNFSGRGIGDVQRVTFKGTEQDPGTALIGIPAPIDTNIFLVALTDAAAAIQTNTQLMRGESWIDIPMQYVSGRRALVTLEKGIPGERVFQEVFTYWDENPLPGEG